MQAKHLADPHARGIPADAQGERQLEIANKSLENPGVALIHALGGFDPDQHRGQAGPLDQQVDLGAGAGAQVEQPPVRVAVSREVGDLRDDEVLERFAVLVGSAAQRKFKRPVERPFHTKVEKIELGIGALLFPHRTMIRGQMKADECVLQNLKVGNNSLRIHSHIAGDVGVIDDGSVCLGRDFEKLPERVEPPGDLFRGDFLFQVGVRVGAKISVFGGLVRKRVNCWQASPAQNVVKRERLPQFRRGERKKIVDEGPAGQQVRCAPLELAGA